MESLYQIACDPNVDLHTRYDAVRTMQHIRKVNPVSYKRRKKNRDYQAEYRRQKELHGG